MFEVDKLPDIAAEKNNSLSYPSLDWVGMSQVEVPIIFLDQNGNTFRQAARADAYVSLDNRSSRGIHMSRLFNDLQKYLSSETLSYSLLDKIIVQFLNSHIGLSENAKLNISFDALIERKTLKSELSGFRTYPITLTIQKSINQHSRVFVETIITYSSTCPASAALSRQLIQSEFDKSFGENLISSLDVREWLGSAKGILATPHAQRSYAKVKVELDYDLLLLQTETNHKLHHLSLIDLIEGALQTPVQSLVKREDEQEFALRNGQNLMFCEDAARRIHKVLSVQEEIVDFQAEVRHVESLHPHDAVAFVSKIRG